jgi:hypothetical protein
VVVGSLSADYRVARAPKAANSVKAKSPEPDDTARLSPDQFFHGAGILIKSMHRKARAARIPGNAQFDRKAALQLIESPADEWDELVIKLWRALAPRRRLPRKRKSAPFQSYKRTRAR